MHGARRYLLLLLLVGQPASADWPQWRGARRDGVSDDRGLLQTWPAEGPRLVWRAAGLGSGYSSVAVAGERIYVTGMVAEQLVIHCLDLAGARRWRTVHGPAWNKSYPGVRATPTIDGGKLYLMSGHALLGCYEAQSGKRLWAVDVAARFGGVPPEWGYAESLLVHDGRLVVTPGGKQFMVALDPASGKVLWTSQGLDDPPAYASPIAVTWQGLSMIVTLTPKGMVGLRADDGLLLWRNARAASGAQVCPTPVHRDGLVFGASQERGGACVRLVVEGRLCRAEQVWETRLMRTHHGGFVLVGDQLYGNHQRGWSCLDWKTGKQRWFGRGVRKGSLCSADGMLYCLSERKGLIGLVRASPEKFEQVSSFSVPGEGNSWAHPVVTGGRLYVRYGDNLSVYDVKR